MINSTGSFTFIVNPNAGRGRAGETVPWLKKRLDLLGIRYELLQTSRRGHGIELARAATGDTVVAVGGDGTINEAINGLDLSKKRLAIIPCGSGNDLIKSLNIPDSVPGAFQVAIGGNQRQIDLGTIEYNPSAGPAGTTLTRRFLNGAGIGFDASVAEQTTHVKYARGFAVYLLAVMKTLGKYRAPLFSITLPNEHISSKCLLIAIGNGRSVGGGFYLTPDAILDDGKMDVCIVEEKSITGILKIMPKVMKGRHGSSDGAIFRRTPTITVEGECAFHVHADGEILNGGSIKSVHVKVGDEKVSVVCQ